MRLFHFLNEEEIISQEEIISLIKRDCSQFLDSFTGTDFLYRGTYLSTKPIFKAPVNKKRKSVDSSSNLHILMDNLFYKTFGIRARSQTIFCTGYEKTADTYGPVYIIFPIGKFEFIWSKEIRDLWNIIQSTDLSKINSYINVSDEEYAFLIYCAILEYENGRIKSPFSLGYEFNPSNDIRKLLTSYYGIENFDSYENVKKEVLKKDVSKLGLSFIKNNYIKNGNITQAIRTKNEIMVYCDSYYALKASKENLALIKDLK